MAIRSNPAAPYLFLLPNLLIFGAFVILPAGYNFYLSAFSTSPFHAPVFVGLANYAQLLSQDDLFWRSLRNTAVFVLGDAGALAVLSLFSALLLNQRIVLRGTFRSAFFYPVLLSPVVVALVWQWILNNQFGVLNAALKLVGISGRPWLLQSGWSMAWAIAVHVWASLGFSTMIILAGLQSIPEELYEAAWMDGAAGRKVLLNVTLPQLAPTMMAVTILSVVRAFEIFDHIYVLTGGGPGTATLMMVQYIYRAAFQLDQSGLASAASVLLFVLLFALTLAQYAAGRRREAV